MNFIIGIIAGIIMSAIGIVAMLLFLYKAYKIAKMPIIDERGMLIQDSYIKINKRDKNLVIKKHDGELEIEDDTGFLADYEDDTDVLIEVEESDDTEILLYKEDADETELLDLNSYDTEIL